MIPALTVPLFSGRDGPWRNASSSCLLRFLSIMREMSGYSDNSRMRHRGRTWERVVWAELWRMHQNHLGLLHCRPVLYPWSCWGRHLGLQLKGRVEAGVTAQVWLLIISCHSPNLVIFLWRQTSRIISYSSQLLHMPCSLQVVQYVLTDLNM